MKIRFYYFVLLFLLTGCGPQIDAWVNSGAKHPVLPVIEPPTFSTSSSKGVQYTPGATWTSSSQVVGKFSLMPTNFATTGTQGQVNLVLSINKNRVQ